MRTLWRHKAVISQYYIYQIFTPHLPSLSMEGGQCRHWDIHPQCISYLLSINSEDFKMFQRFNLFSTQDPLFHCEM